MGARLALLGLLLGLVTPVMGSAHGTANGFEDRFSTLGPLAGTRASDAWEIKSGEWAVDWQRFEETPPLSESNKILIQRSKASTPIEPMVFVRARSFRSHTAQVRAAMLDPLNAFGDLNAGASMGLLFRAPISDGIADKENVYLFSAEVTGVTADYPTGKAYILWKRVGRGYFPLGTKIANTWADFTKPQDLKVVMARGHIQCFVNGRLVIDHVDLPNGDLPTLQDPLPGLPFDQGAVGLRTSGTRAWFDDFVVVGNDAYEARATAVDAYTNYGVSGQGPQGQVRRGASAQLTRELERLSANHADRGLQSHDHDFDEFLVRPVDNPYGGPPSFGATLGTRAAGGTVRAITKIAGLDLAFADPNRRVSVSVQSESITMEAAASCKGTSTAMMLAGATLSIQARGVPGIGDLIVGPIPLEQRYPPNAVVYDRPELLRVIAHYRADAGTPDRVESAALKIVFPERNEITVRGVDPGIPGVTIPGGTPRTSDIRTQAPPLELTVASAVAGRYCG